MKLYNIILIIFLISCSNNNHNPENIMNIANDLRLNNKIDEAILQYKLLIDKCPNSDLLPIAQYQIADIYKNDKKEYEYAISQYQIILDKFNNHDIARKSLFMMAYIYHNDIGLYTQSLNYYKQFEKKYPDDELITSVQFEIEELNKILSKSNLLN